MGVFDCFQTFDFYLFFLLGAFGLLYSILAFREAKNAVKAAKKAGEAVKLQSTMLDISEISRLTHINEGITYPIARDKITEVTAKSRRIISFYRNNSDEEMSLIITELLSSLEGLRTALTTLIPTDEQPNIADRANIVYYTIEPHFTSLESSLNALSGLLERKQINRT